MSLLAILHFVSGPFLLLGGAAVAFVAFSEQGSDRALMLALAAFYAVYGAFSIACGVGLWNLKRYGRTLQIVFSCLGLLFIPIGTLISGLILWYLYKPGVKVLFSETPASQLSAFDVAEVAKVSQTSGATVAIMAVVVLFLLVAFAGIIAAIAIPSLLRARVSANEAQVIGDLRTIVSAEVAYSTSNGGNYDRLECLARPIDCIPGYSPEGPVFLQEVFPAERSGYNREFYGGAPAEANEIAFANLSPTSVRTFAYLAYPVSASTGVRAFCTDSTGRICYTTDGSKPSVVDGLCDPACTTLP